MKTCKRIQNKHANIVNQPILDDSMFQHSCSRIPEPSQGQLKYESYGVWFITYPFFDSTWPAAVFHPKTPWRGRCRRRISASSAHLPCCRGSGLFFFQRSCDYFIKYLISGPDRTAVFGHLNRWFAVEIVILGWHKQCGFVRGILPWISLSSRNSL